MLMSTRQTAWCGEHQCEAKARVQKLCILSTDKQALQGPYIQFVKAVAACIASYSIASKRAAGTVGRVVCALPSFRAIGVLPTCMLDLGVVQQTIRLLPRQLRRVSVDHLKGCSLLACR